MSKLHIGQIVVTSESDIAMKPWRGVPTEIVAIEDEWVTLKFPDGFTGIFHTETIYV